MVEVAAADAFPPPLKAGISRKFSLLFSPPALQLYQEGQYPAPDPTVTLCFGEELQDISSAKTKLIVVQVGPSRSHTHNGIISVIVDNLSKDAALSTADQCGELPEPAGFSQHAAHAALRRRQPEPGDGRQHGQRADGPHLPGLVQLQQPPESGLLPGEHAHHCLTSERWRCTYWEQATQTGR